MMARDDSPAPKGRPPKPMPEPIPNTPENVARAILTTPPKRREDWRFLCKATVD